MFEKEAEEYADEKCGTIETEEKKFCRMDWQKGAEFGYNKAKEEMQEQGLALQSDMDKTIEQNIQLKAQIEKMKCCENCRHHYWLYEELACRIHKIDVDTCNSWEMINGR